jgi:hypothetical protein
VNQGAAVILTSVGAARQAGIDPAKWVYLHGYAAVKDRPVLERPDLSRSRAIEAALRGALAMAGKTARGIEQLDLYSCFPCAVLLAAEVLGVDWRHTPAPSPAGCRSSAERGTIIRCTPSRRWPSGCARRPGNSAWFSPMAASSRRKRPASIRPSRSNAGNRAATMAGSAPSTMRPRRRCLPKRPTR